jgi:uncharacterized repeat protein (TIGR03803 family)
VYEVSASGTETVLYSFGATDADGQNPYAGLVMDTKGNLYGTTYYGGKYAKGTVFELSKSTGTWTETILWNFGATSTDGVNPWCTLILKGTSLYGVTQGGGANGVASQYGWLGYGTAFKLTPAKGRWSETILYNFGASSTDGQGPAAGLVMDKTGNLYGVTVWGGTYGDGTAYKLSPSGTETILHSFGATGDGSYPWCLLIMDTAGNLYGTTTFGGAYAGTYQGGTVFKLTPSGTETILHSFGATSTDPWYLLCGLVRDSKGNLYGTSQNGGTYGDGTVFKVSLLAGTWTNTILWNFGGPNAGAFPYDHVIMDKAGNLYGTTYQLGAYGGGTLFKLVLPVATTTTVKGSPNPSEPAQSVTFTATVTASNKATVNDGSVIFTDTSTSTTLGTANVTSVQAQITGISTLAAGKHKIVAAYVNGADFANSTSKAYTQTVK